MNRTASERNGTRKGWKLSGRGYLTLLTGVLALCVSVGLWCRPGDGKAGTALPGQMEADLKSLVAAMDYLLQPEPDYGLVTVAPPAGTLALSNTGQFSLGPTYSSNLVDLPVATNRAARS